MCQNYIYNNSIYQKLFTVEESISGEVEPILNVSKFIFIWACYQTAVTVYLALFVSETGVHDVQKEEEEEIDLTFRQTISIFKDVAMNKNIWTWWLFKTTCNSVSVVGGAVGSVYLTNDLGFEKEDFAFVSFITIPAGIIISFIAGYLVSKDPIKTYYYATFFSIILDSYYVLHMLRTFPHRDNVTNWTLVHVAAMSIVSSFQGTF